MVQRRVLVAEDDPDIAELLKLFLEFAGYEVIPAANGQAAVALATAFAPHVVLINVHLPDMDGDRVCSLLRAETRTATLPILMISGRPHWNEVSTCFRAGATSYLTHPLDLTRLRQTLSDVLS
jgi:two-component system alkaline phosphatase synthesis response regulator PhoP